MRLLGHSVAALSAVVAAPVGLGALLLRPAWRVGLRERLGAPPRQAPGAVWLHAASVGEIQAAARLIEPLREGGREVFTTTFTVTAREMARRRRPEVACHLAPLDHPWCVAFALKRVRPGALVLIETELWPAWIAAAERRETPVALISARVSDRSFARYRRLGPWVPRMLRRLAAIGARTAEDAERFAVLGARPDRISITGDLKLEPRAAPAALAPELAAVLGGTPLWVAGSTHPGEESAALAALAALEREGLAPALVLAPRHLERAWDVLRAVRATGRLARLRSAVGSAPLEAGEVLVLDSMGELAALYGRSDVAFVGGSLVARGGHNVLEPAFAGRPVLFGPHTENVRQAVEMLSRCGAGIEVRDAAGLAPVLSALLRDPGAARKRGEEGRLVLQAHRGSAARAVALVEGLLTSRRPA